MIYPGGGIDIDVPDGKVNSSLCVLRMVTKANRAWMAFFSFIYNGEPYDYAFELCDMEKPEEHAREQITALDVQHRANLAFLRDVTLKDMQ